ncbi:MAG: Na+/H+ antiporter subunit E [Deltaproteobacteria bacterium]|nr:Na+/H+ antiporter subunit E [Deltaproteobacteria bacterium]
MLGCWLVLSGRFDALHLSLGLISSGLAAYFSADIPFPSLQLQSSFRLPLRFMAYVPWLIYQIVVANLNVLRLCLHSRPRQAIDPSLVRFDSRLKSDLALLALALANLGHFSWAGVLVRL